MVKTGLCQPHTHGPCGKMQVSMVPGGCGFHNLALQTEEPLPKVWSWGDAGISNHKAIYQVCHKNECVWVFQKTFYGLYVQRVCVVHMCVAEGLHSMSQQPSDLPRYCPHLVPTRGLCHCTVVGAMLTPPPFLACGPVQCFQYCMYQAV